MRFDSLQIGRGIAALLVVLVHATTFSRLNYHRPFAGNLFHRGSAGVVFFFVLSGFIICHRHGDDIGQPRALAGYLWRRLVRVFPIYWIVTLAILPAYFLFPRLGQGDETSPSIIATSLLLLPAYRAPILVAGWSLIHELWFYGLFALGIGIRGKGIRWLMAAWSVGIGVLAVSGWHRTEIAQSPWARLIFSSTYLEFLLGCAAAYLLRKRWLSTRVAVGVFFTGLISFLVLLSDLQVFPGTPNQRVAAFGLSAFLLILGAACWESNSSQPSPYVTRGNSRYTPLILLGDASYALYLVHGPVLSSFCKLMTSVGLTRHLGANLISWIAIVVCVLTAWLLHQFIEKPLLWSLHNPPWAKTVGDPSRLSAA